MKSQPFISRLADDLQERWIVAKYRLARYSGTDVAQCHQDAPGLADASGAGGDDTAGATAALTTTEMSVTCEWSAFMTVILVDPALFCGVTWNVSNTCAAAPAGGGVGVADIRTIDVSCERTKKFGGVFSSLYWTDTVVGPPLAVSANVVCESWIAFGVAVAAGAGDAGGGELLHPANSNPINVDT